MHQYWEGVEKGKTKRVYRLERAAMGGHLHARKDLAKLETCYGRLDLGTMRH